MNDYKETFDARGQEYNAAHSICPRAREFERLAILRRLSCEPGNTIIDAPAGGGYVADGLVAKYGGSVEIICVEPSANFAKPLRGHYRTLINSLDQVALPDNSVDGIVSLAGLHHIHVRRPVYHEWLRLLKPGGRVVVGDVSAGTGTGEFLNTFVNQHTPGGHEGIFIEEEEFRSQLADTGFNVCEERLDDVPWQFPDQDTMGRFCKKLFSIVTADTAETVAALKEYVGFSVGPEKTIQLAWQLRYAVAIAD